MRKYVVLLSAILMQTLLGGIYAWSAFVPALQNTHGLTAGQTQIIFGLTIAVFTITMVFAGRQLKRHTPRTISTIGAVLFALGYLIASRSGGSLLLLILGLAGISGMGIGACYICPLSTGIQWFPKRKGMITGLTVAGFGGGAVLLSSAANSLLAQGQDVLAVFGWIGLLYGVLLLMAAQGLRLPKGEAVPADSTRPAAANAVRFGNLWSDGRFRRLCLGIFTGTFGGLLVIGSLKPIALEAGIALSWAVWGITAFSAGNALGRVAWGWAYDRLGIVTIPVSLAFLGTTMLTLIFLPPIGWLFGLAALLVGFGFGACFVLYAAQVGSDFGPHTVGTVYPFIFLFYGAAGVIGPWMGGWLFDATDGYRTGLVSALAVLAIGTILFLRIEARSPRDQVAEPSVPAGSVPSRLPRL